MKRKIALSTALVLSLAALLLVKSDSTVHAEQPQKFVSDTGVITLSSNQSLIITVVRSSTSEDEGPPIQHVLQFRRMTYGDDVCSGGVCKQTVASVTNSGPIPLMPGQAASFQIGPDVHGNDVRGLILSNSRDVRVNTIVFDTSTQRVVSIAHTTTTMYWP